MRESTDRRWVAGIAWDRFLSAQAHNPWDCMHLAVRVGPLRRGESRIVRGRLYLMRGRKEDLLRRYEREFPAVRAEALPTASARHLLRSQPAAAHAGMS